MPALGQLNAELAGDDTRAAVGGIASDSDAHGFSFDSRLVGLRFSEKQTDIADIQRPLHAVCLAILGPGLIAIKRMHAAQPLAKMRLTQAGLRPAGFSIARAELRRKTFNELNFFVHHL